MPVCTTTSIDHREQSPVGANCARASQRDGPITFRDVHGGGALSPAVRVLHDVGRIDGTRRRLRHEPGGASDVRRAGGEADLPSSGTLCRVRPRFDIVEHGGGSGLLARDILALGGAATSRTSRARCGIGSSRSAPRFEMRSGERWSKPVLAERVEWRDAPPPGITGCVLSNELIDAFPVHRVVREDGELREVFVAIDWRRATSSTHLRAALRSGARALLRRSRTVARRGLLRRGQSRCAAMDGRGRAHRSSAVTC